MSIQINSAEDLREGDYATFSFEGHEFSGELYRDSYGDLVLGPSLDVVHSDGRMFGDIEFVSATRGPRELPTKLSVIRARDIDNGWQDYDELLLQGPDEDGDFLPLTGQDATGYFRPEKIEDFDILWTLDEEAA